MILTKFININIPWSWLTVLVAINFYTCGNLLKNIILEKKKINNVYIVIFFLLNVISKYFNSGIDMYSNTYGNIILFLISSYSGIMFLIFFVKNFIKKSKIFEYIGKNSLVILAFHRRAMTITKILFVFILGINMPKENLLFDLGYVMWEVILCVPAIIILNKYFPYFIGKKKDRGEKIVI